MMENHTYYINKKPYSVCIDNNQEYLTGTDVILSDKDTDITYHQAWYNQGYTIQSFLNSNEFENLKQGVNNCIKNIAEEILNSKIPNFTLENYHNLIINDNDHYKIVSKTRDLFSKDFNFPIEKMIPKFEKILGFSLTDIDPKTGWKAHIILRINRPYSNDYNPPHKDIYEHYDDEKYIPKFVNFWVPICGVTEKSMLPISPETHRLSENLILRTNVGSNVGSNKYRVRSIKEWDRKVDLYRYPIEYGQVLLFSSHLIHGLAINEETNTTRVALEFRLYKYE